MRDFALYNVDQEHDEEYEEEYKSSAIGGDLLRIKFRFFKYTGYQREIDPPRDLRTVYINSKTYIGDRVLDIHSSYKRTANLRNQIARLISDSIHTTEDDRTIILERLFQVLDDPFPHLVAVVEIAEVTLQIVDDGDPILGMESLTTLVPRLIPATKSSVEGLEKIGLDRSLELKSIIEETPICVICMEDFDDGEEKARGIVITRMPCLHSYHEDCIVRWLETNHWCPICRYRMPTVELGACAENPNKRARLH